MSEKKFPWSHENQCSCLIPIEKQIYTSKAGGNWDQLWGKK